MGEVNTGPCTPWATVQDLELAPGFNPDNEIEPQILSDALEVATSILYELSAHQFPGVCSATVRPNRRAAWNPLFGIGWSSNYAFSDPFGWNSTWGWCTCDGSSYDSCNCGNVDQIELGGYPVVAVQAVHVNGVLLPTSAYRVDDFRWLVRIDGDSWPASQDISLPNTALNTFEVTFTYGHSIPTLAKHAARRLAMELAKAYSGKACKLPERIATISRQGVTMAFVDTMAFFKDNRTGIYEVDLFLQAVNPRGRTNSAVIMSVDVPSASRKINT